VFIPLSRVLWGTGLMLDNIPDTLDWRYETKFSLIRDDEQRFLDWIAGTPDFYRVYPTRRVNSVYLDSADYDCAIANLNGTGWRSKFRMRWYGIETNPETVTFEVKLKRGRLGTKQSCQVNLSTLDPCSLSSSETDLILRQVHKAGNIFGSVDILNPVLFVGYEREYFQGMSGVKMTVDRELIFQNVMDRQGVDNREIHRDLRIVLEFKFNPEQKDQATEIMSDFPFSATRNSKYILGLSHIGKAMYF
jgi:hypothetical protein